jgi:hypothetical protein
MSSKGRIPELPSKIYTDIPKSIGTGFSEAFRISLVEQTTASWELWFGLLEEFVEHHGHARVKQHDQIRGRRLGDWATLQRRKFVKGELDAKHICRLAELPAWTWDRRAAQWEMGFSKLLDYVALSGHARVSSSYKAEGFALGQWVTQQRISRAEGSGRLTQEYQRRLAQLPGWTWTPFSDKWEEAFAELLRYVGQHGDAFVPVGFKMNDFNLGAWVAKQRTLFNRGNLAVHRSQRLATLPNWTWNPFVAKWEERFAYLLRYVDEHGDARVPPKCQLNGFNLGFLGR